MSKELELEERQLRESFTKAFRPLELKEARFDSSRWQSQRTSARRRNARRSWWPIAAGAVFACLLAVSVVVYTQRPPTQNQLQAHHSTSQASIARLVHWNRDRELYAIALQAASGHPAEVVFLVPKSISIPRTIASWPPKGFAPVAVLNDPATQLGTGTGTLWLGMQSYLYWLHPVRGGILPTSSAKLHIGSSGKAVLAVAPGELFAISLPTTQYPHRTIFLRSVGFALPYTLTKWPPDQFEVVAVYQEAEINAHPQLALNSYPSPPHTLVLNSTAERELLTKLYGGTYH